MGFCSEEFCFSWQCTVTVREFKGYNSELFNHPPYGSNLFNIIYFLSFYFILRLRSKRFNGDDEFKNRVIDWFKLKEVKFFWRGTKKLVNRYKKCAEIKGQCLERRKEIYFLLLVTLCYYFFFSFVFFQKMCWGRQKLF